MTIFLGEPERIGDGLRLAVKDLFDTAGLRTTYGSILFADHVPDRTAPAVARLEAAGYANVGKTNLHEFAYGITSYNPHFGAVPNPLAPDRTSGGSSAGSAAALAAGLADAALGTDSGGSIRIPAACCGVVGFPFPEGIGTVFMREAAESHRDLFPEHADAYGDNVRAKLESCARVTDGELEIGLRRLEEYRERAAEAFEGLDLLVTPTLAFVAPAAMTDDRELRASVIRFTYPFNALGWPALALPSGPAEHGLPASVQLVAPTGEDARVLAAGSLLERDMAARASPAAG